MELGVGDEVKSECSLKVGVRAGLESATLYKYTIYEDVKVGVEKKKSDL